MAEFTKDELEAELELRRRNKPSDELQAIIASLTNDEGARIEYLKRKRFPDNPNVIYFKDEDNDLAYIDPTTKEIKKEFREYNDWVDSYDIFGKIVPAVQVGAEVFGGILGLEGGYKKKKVNIRGISIPLPGGRIGGAGGGAFGTGLMSGTVYTGREILSELVDGPELNFNKLSDDLITNSAFGGIPIGISRQAKIVNKFGYTGGDNDLALIMRTAQDADNQAARKLAKDEFGIDLTVAEIEYGKNPSRLVQLQNYLGRGKEGYRMSDYYANTTLQINEAVDTYLSELQSGKYVVGKKVSGITGEGDINPMETIKDLSEGVIKTMAAKKEARYLKLLNQAKEETKPYYYGADGNLLDPIQQADIEDLLLGADDSTTKAYLQRNGLTVKNELIKVDVTPIINKLDNEIAKTNSPIVKETLETIKKTFYNGDTLKNSIADLDELRKIDLDNLATTNVTKGAYQKSKVPYGYKEDLNQLLKQYSENYKIANSVYDPSKPHTQVLEKSIVGVLSKIIGDDTKTAKTLQRVFRGNASPREVTAFRRLMQTKDPQAFQNLKHMFLQDEIATATGMPQFIRKVGFGNLDPRYVKALDEKRLANKNYTDTIAEFGLNSREATLAGNSKKLADNVFTNAEKYLDTRKKVYQALFEPQEFETLVKLMDVVQKASFIKGKSESATYGFNQIRDDIMDQFRGGSGKLADTVLNLLNVITPRAARDTFKKNTADQTEKLMIDMLTSSPENLDVLNEAINVVMPYLYAGQQATTRGFREIRKEEDEGVVTQDDVVEELQEQSSNLQSQLDSALESFTPSNIPLVPPITAVTPDSMLSETILPNPKDREIAERLMANKGGIGGLA
jgi:hypothetical protein|tara:strand:- start:352 stop:2901 length:2550 start_codon:yes stop_codon:yes gene_type:complete